MNKKPNRADNMVRDDFREKFKIIVIIALIFGIMGAIFYLFYGFAFLWQAMAATVYIILLSIIAIIFIALSIYLQIKNLLLKRDLKNSEKEIKKISMNLERCYADLERIKSYPIEVDDEKIEKK
ncbi:MAG: hypothetical protein LLF83_06275 [Methanobacterium sp.]|nr:hypothetical protein [Methanobacterium sp.]